MPGLHFWSLPSTPSQVDKSSGDVAGRSHSACKCGDYFFRSAVQLVTKTNGVDSLSGNVA